MASFCSYCASKITYRSNIIDIKRIFNNLEKNEFTTIGICQNCGLKAIAKDKNGYIKLCSKLNNLEWLTEKEHIMKLVNKEKVKNYNG